MSNPVHPPWTGPCATARPSACRLRRVRTPGDVPLRGATHRPRPPLTVLLAMRCPGRPGPDRRPQRPQSPPLAHRRPRHPPDVLIRLATLPGRPCLPIRARRAPSNTLGSGHRAPAIPAETPGGCSPKSTPLLRGVTCLAAYPPEIPEGGPPRTSPGSDAHVPGGRRRRHASNLQVGVARGAGEPPTSRPTTSCAPKTGGIRWPSPTSDACAGCATAGEQR